MVPDNGEAATTVEGSPAHSTWVSGGEPAAPAAPAAPAVDTPATPAAPAAPKGPATLVTDAPVARPGEKAGTIQDASKAFLDKHKASDRASKTAPAAPASPAAPAAAPAAVAGAIKAGDAAATAAAAAGATPAQAAAAGDAAAEEFLEAQVNGQPFKIPMSAMVPVKVNGKIQMVPLKNGVMMETDYRHKTAALGSDRRALVAEQARTKAEQEQLAADRKQYEDAQLDPEKFEQYQEHLKQLQSNPIYKANWERGRAAALDSAELNAFRGAEAESVVHSAAESVENTINSLAREYPGVDIARVRSEYATALVNERAELTEASLRSYFQREAQAVQHYAGPLQKQLEALQATVDSLAKAKTDETAATTHNENTRRAIDRDEKGRFTAPAGGGAPDVTRDPPPQPFTSDQLQSRIKSWVNKGRGEASRR